MSMIFTSIPLILALLYCDPGRFNLIREPYGSTTNGTLQARDVPGALDYTNSTKRFTSGVCAAMYGLREATLQRRLFPIALGEYGGWAALQDALPDLTSFELYPTNYVDNEYGPPYCYRVTPKGTRCIDYWTAEVASIDNDLYPPVESNRCFRTPRITKYLYDVCSRVLTDFMNGRSRLMSSADPYDEWGTWLDPTVDYTSLVTDTWCVDGSAGTINIYSKFLRSLSEMKNDVSGADACGTFGGKDVWKTFFPSYDYEYTMKLYGMPTATAEFEKAKARRSGSISEYILKAAPGLKASFSNDYAKALKKVAESESTRIWWERFAMANGIVSLHSRWFTSLGVSGMKASPDAEIDTRPSARLNAIHGKKNVLSGNVGKAEYYKIDSGVTIGTSRVQHGTISNLEYVALLDPKGLAVTNTVNMAYTSTLEDTSFDGSEVYAYWERGNDVEISISIKRDVAGTKDQEECLPNYDAEKGENGPEVIRFDDLDYGAEKEYDLGRFRLVVVDLPYPDGARYYEYRVERIDDASYALVQKFNVPKEGWGGDGMCRLTGAVSGEAPVSSDPPSSWLDFFQTQTSDNQTAKPIGLVTAGSPMASMVTANAIIGKFAMAGTNAWSDARYLKNDPEGEQNTWFFNRLRMPGEPFAPTTEWLMEVSEGVNGASAVKAAIGEILGQLPGDGFSPFDTSEISMSGEDPKGEVEKQYPKTYGHPGQKGVIPWLDETAWVYVLKRDSEKEGGLYHAFWRVKNEKSPVAQLTFGSSHEESKPSKHSNWVEYKTRCGMILNFDFPMMNSGGELGAESK